VDFNVPLREGTVMDTTRLQLVVPTLQVFRQRKNTCILMSHLGRPKGRNADLSLRFLVPILESLLGEPVVFVPNPVNDGDFSPEAAYLLLENLRFYPGEAANEISFAQQLSRWGDFYINEAFSVAHRAHASIVGVPAFLPHAAGPLFQRELKALQSVTECPVPPVFALVGGSKISTKFGVLRHLLKKVNTLAVGGGLANTFLAAQGHEIGTSLQEPALHEKARLLIQEAQQEGRTLLLPCDVVVRTEKGTTQIYPVEAIPFDAAILDVGPMTVRRLEEEIARARTVLWNGPLGQFEEPPFHKATEAVLRTLATATRERSLVSVVGGGDSVAALHAASLDFSAFSYVSTSGGAFLEFLEGKELPGIRALQDS
jgi:phosphoglycerate kinase